MNCVQPMQAVPAAFYASTLPALPEALPGGREVLLTEPEPMVAPGSTVEPAPNADFPMPRSNPELGPSQVPVRGTSSGGGGGCSLAVADAGLAGWSWLAALGAAASLRRRRSH
jgi:MYXO-CTERM domain-containing protein